MAEGIARAGFDIDLREGVAREGALVHVFLRARVEHKRDYKCMDTGNLFVEYRQKHGAPSGLSTTTAAFWAFEYDRDCWLIVPTERVRRVAKASSKIKGRLVLGGDFNNFRGILVKLRDLILGLEPAPR
jgi:hypothetical protein